VRIFSWARPNKLSDFFCPVRRLSPYRSTNSSLKFLSNSWILFFYEPIAHSLRSIALVALMASASAPSTPLAAGRLSSWIRHILLLEFGVALMGYRSAVPLVPDCSRIGGQSRLPYYGILFPWFLSRCRRHHYSRHQCPVSISISPVDISSRTV
jgi:hypothetical protein